MNQTVIGVFDTKNQAQSAKEALISANFNNSNIDFSTYGEYGTYGERYETERDGISGFFRDLFDLDEKESYRYADVAGRGTVVTVHTKNMAQAKKAAAILDRYGAIDFGERATAYESGSFDVDANRAYVDKTFGNGGMIEVVEEDIAIGKREIETGGVTVRSRVIEKPVTETLRLREEHVYVNRTPVDRPATNAAFTGETISMKEVAEEAVVSKSARVVEEIEVGKEVTERTETIKDTVRETEVDVVETEGEVVRKYNDTKTNTDRV